MTQTQWARRVIKPAVFLACLIPVSLLVYGAFWGDLGANPVETITNTTGIWTLRLIVITLAITPARWLTKWNTIIQFRRMLGLFAFFYASLHFASYIVLDQFFDWRGMLVDIGKRPFILAGTLTFVLMVPLAVTSTKGWIRRLGRRWQMLHRLIYVSAVCAAVHFAWKVKVISGDPVVYAALVALLLGFRVVWAMRKRIERPRRPVPQSAA
jgi:methionine sulfoxide reductase heme-binding subunit